MIDQIYLPIKSMILTMLTVDNRKKQKEGTISCTITSKTCGPEAFGYY